MRQVHRQIRYRSRGRETQGKEAIGSRTYVGLRDLEALIERIDRLLD
jgi:hypothetical protein